MRRLALAAVVAAGLSLVGTQPASAAPSAATQQAMETRVTQLVNAHRARAGCRALRVDSRLVTAARRHSQDMARRRYFSHTSPGGTTPWQRIAATGYPRAALAENIAAGQPTAAAVVDAWMRSPGHRRNILNCGMRAVGVGLATGGPYGYHWTQDFGSR